MNLLAIVAGYLLAKMFGKLAAPVPFEPQPTPAPVPGGDVRSRPPRPATRSRRPQGPVTPVSNVVTPPWPQVVPSGLPAFPGPGWEPDAPPPASVQQRASALLPALWGSGEGTWKVEKTDGRWIVYRAVAMGQKRGVVAYRELQPQLRDAFGPLLENDDTPQPVIDLDQGGTQTAVYKPGAPVPGPTPTVALPTLRRGASGKEVLLVQQLLFIAPADGKFGPMTEHAVRQFQGEKGLTPDGIVGRMTWGALLGRSA